MADKKFNVGFDIVKQGMAIPRGHHAKEVMANNRQEAIDQVHKWCRVNYGCHAFHCKATVVKDES